MSAFNIVPSGGTWKKFDDARPYMAVSGIAVDRHGNFPILYRSDKVRSAKNSWSLPSGLHEVGRSLAGQFAEELEEELNLQCMPSRAKISHVYENIAGIEWADQPDLDVWPPKENRLMVEGGDSWHWVIALLVIPVKTLSTLVNKEPDKHSEIRVVNMTELGGLITQLKWAPNLGPALREAKNDIKNTFWLQITQGAFNLFDK